MPFTRPGIKKVPFTRPTTIKNAVYSTSIYFKTSNINGLQGSYKN